jgi:stage V sporulation protein B
MITVLVLGNILGDNGIAYVAFSVECFMLFWTFTGNGLADTLGKLLRGRSARGQYKNASKLRRNALILEFAVGVLGSAVMFACAGVLGEKLFELNYCIAMIRVLAPVVCLRALSSVLLGYFQGEGTELPTVISHLMRQICILIFSLIFAELLGRYGQKVSALLKQENFTAMYGGLGVALGILVSETLVLLFLFLVYRGSRGKEKKTGGEGMRTTDTFGSQVYILYGGLFPLVLTMFFQKLPIWLGMVFFRRSIAEVSGLSDYGVFYGRYLPLIGILILPGCAILLRYSYKVAGCLRKEEQRYARGHFGGGLHMGVIYGFFFSVFMTALAPQLAGIFCSTGQEQAAQMLRYGSFVILFALVGFFFSELLVMMGGDFQVIGALALCNLVFVISLVLFLNSGHLGILSLVDAGVISSAVYAAATGTLLFLQIRIGIDWLQWFVVPGGASFVAGLVILLISKGITPHLGNLMTVAICLAVGLICYWLILLLMRNFREQELNYIPGGKLIRTAGRILRLY